jgi:hypothetical protein
MVQFFTGLTSLPIWTSNMLKSSHRYLYTLTLSSVMVSSIASRLRAQEEQVSLELVATANEESSQSTVASIKKSKRVEEISAVEVEMFAALDSGELKIDYLPQDATKAVLVFRNETNKPLKIKLAETFGALPVLAQGFGGGGGGGFGGGGGLGGGGGIGGGGGGGQGGGGGLGGAGGGGGFGGQGGGGGLFRVEVDKPRKLTATTVCLEQGKPDPSPRMNYRIVRLEEVNPSLEVAEVCRALGYGKVSQKTAQAAAWHLANDLSWDRLSTLPRVISKYTGVEYFFSPSDIQAAMQVVAAAKIATSDSDSDSESYSQESSELRTK